MRALFYKVVLIVLIFAPYIAGEHSDAEFGRLFPFHSPHYQAYPGVSCDDSTIISADTSERGGSAFWVLTSTGLSPLELPIADLGAHKPTNFRQAFRSVAQTSTGPQWAFVATLGGGADQIVRVQCRGSLSAVGPRLAPTTRIVGRSGVFVANWAVFSLLCESDGFRSWIVSNTDSVAFTGVVSEETPMKGDLWSLPWASCLGQFFYVQRVSSVQKLYSFQWSETDLRWKAGVIDGSPANPDSLFCHQETQLFLTGGAPSGSGETQYVYDGVSFGSFGPKLSGPVQCLSYLNQAYFTASSISRFERLGTPPTVVASGGYVVQAKVLGPHLFFLSYNRGAAIVQRYSSATNTTTALTSSLGPFQLSTNNILPSSTNQDGVLGYLHAYSAPDISGVNLTQGLSLYNHLRFIAIRQDDLAWVDTDLDTSPGLPTLCFPQELRSTDVSMLVLGQDADGLIVKHFSPSLGIHLLRLQGLKSRLFADISPGPDYEVVEEVSFGPPVQGRQALSVYSSLSGIELWAGDGQRAELLMDFTPGCGSTSFIPTAQHLAHGTQHHRLGIIAYNFYTINSLIVTRGRPESTRILGQLPIEAGTASSAFFTEQARACDGYALFQCRASPSRTCFSDLNSSLGYLPSLEGTIISDPTCVEGSITRFYWNNRLMLATPAPDSTLTVSVVTSEELKPDQGSPSFCDSPTSTTTHSIEGVAVANPDQPSEPGPHK